MAKELKDLALALEMLNNAESSVRSAKQIIMELTGSTSKVNKEKLEEALTELQGPTQDGDDQVIEGIFDGEKMLGKDGNSYVVPANYASKSKMLAGDLLKLTIKTDGTFVYKQISPAPRKHVMGTLVYEDNKYKVLVEGKLYDVLLASVTYFKGEIGDKVSLIVNATGDFDWGAIEAIVNTRDEVGGIPQPIDDNPVQE